VRVVIDTNVLVSGLFWKGPASEILDAFLAGRFELYASEELIAELREVLSRPKFQTHALQRGLDVPEVVERLKATARIIPVDSLPPQPALRDPDDIIVLECAVSANATMIVTGDQDLLVLESFAGISILTPARALSELTK